MPPSQTGVCSNHSGDASASRHARQRPNSRRGTRAGESEIASRATQGCDRVPSRSLGDVTVEHGFVETVSDAATLWNAAHARDTVEDTTTRRRDVTGLAMAHDEMALIDCRVAGSSRPGLPG